MRTSAMSPWLLVGMVLAVSSRPAAAAHVPPAWVGVWAVTDTVYDNYGVQYRTYLDTLCTDEEITATIPNRSDVHLGCSGPARGEQESALREG